jgi:hypothetical protein
LLHFLGRPAQPKHHIQPCPVRLPLLPELPFQSYLERLGIGSLVFSCGWVQEHGGNGSQFTMNSFCTTRIPGYGHLSYPAVEPRITENVKLWPSHDSRCLQAYANQLATFANS